MLSKEAGWNRENFSLAYTGHLVVKGYHGGTIKGNACPALLKLGEKLLDDKILGDVLKFKMLNYINAIK